MVQGPRSKVQGPRWRYHPVIPSPTSLSSLRLPPCHPFAYLPVIPSPYLPVIPSRYLPLVILSPSPCPVILSAAKDLLSLFEMLLPLRTGSAKDLLPSLLRMTGLDCAPRDDRSRLHSKKCAGPGVSGPALRRGFEAVRGRQPAGLELPVGYRSIAPDDPFESAEIVGRRHSLRKRRPRELKPKPGEQEARPLKDTEGSTRFDIEQSPPCHDTRNLGE
jgi:hypothetical protein